MAWVFGIACYIALVALFLRFFAWVKGVDEDLEEIRPKEAHRAI